MPVYDGGTTWAVLFSSVSGCRTWIEPGGKAERKEGFRLLFSLVNSVTIPKHEYMYFSQADVDFGRALERELRLALEGPEGPAQ